MIGQYKHLISENVAPKGVETISIYDSNDVKKASIAVPEFMKYPSDIPLYTFGVVSDAHITETEGDGDGFDFALGYFKSVGAKFTAFCGDITNTGFYDANGALYVAPFAKFKSIKEKYADDSFAVYVISGNHESYMKAITEDLTLYQQYTGNTLYYSGTQGNDVFLFIGQPASYRALNAEQLTWVQTQLTTHADNRCFVFIHPYIPNDSGNPYSCYGNDAFTGIEESTGFFNALRNHGNVIVFHGHSHFMFRCQEDESTCNYTNKNGFHSVHVPSCQWCASISYDSEGNPHRSVDASNGINQGYLVEVFRDCIVLNGIDFSLVNGTRNVRLVPQGIIKIDTN